MVLFYITKLLDIKVESGCSSVFKCLKFSNQVLFCDGISVKTTV